MLKKILCVLLSVLMVASLLPMGVVADGSHSITLYGAVDATLNYSSAEAGTVVTVTPGEGLGIYALYFYTTDYTYMGDVEYTISDDNSSATFVMPDYDVLVSGEIVRESVHEFEYTLFGEYDWTIAQEDLEAYDGDDTEAKLLTWINSVMSTWDIDESIVWEASIYYLTEPVAEDAESGVEAADGTFGIRITLPDDNYTFGRSGTIVATTSSSSTEEVLAANQALIATLSEILNTDEVMYIDQLGSNEDYSGYDYFYAIYYSEKHPNWDEVVANWISSLGDEANVGIIYIIDSYVAPVAGTEDDPDGTDGSFIIAYIADVGSEEDGTYVESEYFFVDVVIVATPYCTHDSLKKVEAKAATCDSAGNTEYWYCADCGKYFSDENGENQISKADTVTAATGHTAGTAVIENYVKVTADADGSYDTVTYCTVCGEEISRSHTVIAAYGSGSAEVIDWATVLAGANSSNDTNTTTVEDVVIEEPIEPTDTETEDDGEEEPAAEPAVEAETPAETNPTTGVVISLIPMAIAALAVVSSKRK